MGDGIRSEMTKVIDNLTTSAITKIVNHMSTQFGAMSTNVSTIITQMNQASANTMKVFNNATQQYSYSKIQPKARTTILPWMFQKLETLHQNYSHKYSIIRIPPSHGKKEPYPDGFKRFRSSTIQY
eukprot:13496434-Ditylum_brightwellii.AAC.1